MDQLPDDFARQMLLEELRGWTLAEAANDDARRRDRFARRAADVIEAQAAEIKRLQGKVAGHEASKRFRDRLDKLLPSWPRP